MPEKSKAPSHALVGAIAPAYSLRWWLTRDDRPARAAGLVHGTLWSTLAGFTSFSVHAGGPPLHIYLLSQKLDKIAFQATSVAFFFGVNWLKLGPCAWLAPLAPLGIHLGGRLQHRIDETIFFRIVNASLVWLAARLSTTGRRPGDQRTRSAWIAGGINRGYGRGAAVRPAAFRAGPGVSSLSEMARACCSP